MKATLIEGFEARARAGDADVEAIIAAWAKSGILKKAATQAIADAHSKGRSVTIIEDDTIYLLMPDGSRQEVRKLSRKHNTTYTSGTLNIG